MARACNAALLDAAGWYLDPQTSEADQPPLRLRRSTPHAAVTRKLDDHPEPESRKKLKEENPSPAAAAAAAGVEEDGDSEEDNQAGDWICAICDDGGDLLCCDGPCLRSFHGRGTECYNSLRITDSEVKQAFYCRNCSQQQHQCFECGRLGSSLQGPGQEVFLCDAALCGKFYHRSCVSKLLGGKNVAEGFICPLHACRKCHLGEGEEPSEWLYECRRCPRAWHLDCKDERIKFDGAEVRAWQLGKTRFLYCMLHRIDPELGTPRRNHLVFPVARPEIRVPRTIKGHAFTQGSLKEAPLIPRQSRADIVDPVLAIIEESKRLIAPAEVDEKLKRSCPQTVASAPNELCHMNRIKSLMNAFNKSRAFIDAGGSVEEARCIFPLKDLKVLEQAKKALRVYLSPLAYGLVYSTYGRHFTMLPKLQVVVNRLCWYVSAGDIVADLCCGANTFSRLMSERLSAMNKACRFKNYDLFQPSDTFCFERRDYTTITSNELGNGNQLIIGLNPPFGVRAQTASAFARLAASFRPKLIVLIAPRETQRLEAAGYTLIWEDTELLKGDAFYLPGSVDSNGNEISHENHDAPVLFLWSRDDWRDFHVQIAMQMRHLLTW